MRKEKLSQLLDISIGRTPSRNEQRYWGPGHKWVSIRDLNSKIITETKEQITDLAVKETRCKIVRKGTLLFSFKLTIGKMAFAGCDLFTNEAIAAFLIKDERKLNSEFLYYALQSATFGGSNQAVMGKTLNSKTLAEIEIPLPPLDDQIRIAHLLGKVEGLIAQRKQHLQQLDKLLKSVFLEMFGDPVRNEKGWEKKLLQYLCHSPKDIKCGPFGTQLNKSEFQKSGIPVWGIPQINSEFAIPPNDFVTKEKAGELEEYSVRHNDIVMSRKGAVGKCSLYPPSMSPGIMHSDVLRIRADWTKTNPIYLCWQLRLSRDVERQIANVSSGAIMAGINVGKLKSITVFIPPISLQNQFATIVEKVEGVKSRYQQSLAELETLYGALSQQAFKGELDLSRAPLPGIKPEEEKAVVTEPVQARAEESLRPLSAQSPVSV